MSVQVTPDFNWREPKPFPASVVPYAGHDQWWEADRRHANLTHDIERCLRVRQHHRDEVESIVCKVVGEEGCALK